MRILYAVWLILPVTFFLCFLWSLLERKRKGKTTETGDLWRSTIHVSMIVAIAIVAHK